MKGCLSVRLSGRLARRCDAKRHGVVTDKPDMLRPSHHKTKGELERTAKCPKQLFVSQLLQILSYGCRFF